MTANTPKPKKKRRLRKLLMLASLVGAVVSYRERKLSENEAGSSQS